MCTLAAVQISQAAVFGARQVALKRRAVMRAARLALQASMRMSIAIHVRPAHSICINHTQGKTHACSAILLARRANNTLVAVVVALVDAKRVQQAGTRQGRAQVVASLAPVDGITLQRDKPTVVIAGRVDTRQP